MLKGLRKRESYEELINELGEDPIKRYPNRDATQIENSNFMSQLASGFREVIEQHDRVLKEQTKELLLQEISATSSRTSHVSFQSLNSLGLNQYMQAAQGVAPFQPRLIPQRYNIQTPNSPRSQASSKSEATTSVKSEEPAPRQMDMDDNADLREMRYKLFGPDIDPEVVFQAFDNAREQQEREREQQERQQQIVAQVRQDHEDIMKNNPFEGVFSGGARSSNYVPEPVKTLVDKIEEKEEKKKKGRAKKLDKPNDEPDDQPEETRGRSSSRPKRTAPVPPAGRPEPKRKTSNEKSDDDEVAITGVNLNTSTNLKFWKSQSPNEIRAQLKLRKLPINEYAFLKKKDLVEYVRNLIITKKW